MKRALLCLLAFAPMISHGQTIVSTTPQNKNVVLEQYTGVNCGYCPDGSRIARQIYEANPDRVVLIAVHAGSYANPSAGQPDFRTPFGNGLVGQAGVAGFPAASVNRTRFDQWAMQGGTAMGRGNWTAAANQILQQAAPVNVAATASIDLSTRTATVYVEAYYTQAQNGTQKINVVMLQDHTIGYQSNGGSNYEHNNRLVHMLTGQWGEDVTDCAANSLHEFTFTYQIPEHHNNIPIKLGDVRFAVFIAENQQYILNGVQVSPEITGAPDFRFGIQSIASVGTVCQGSVAPTFTLASQCNGLQQLDFLYTVNDGEPGVYSWTGNLNYDESATIELPAIDFELEFINTLRIEALNEDDTPDDNVATATFNKAPASLAGNAVVQLRTDAYGSEVSWNLKNAAGNTISGGGPYANSAQTHEIPVTLPEGDYLLTINDAYGDGMANGYIRVLVDNSTVVNIQGSSYSQQGTARFSIVEPAQVTFDPANGATGAPADGPWTITCDKKMYTVNSTAITTENVGQVVTLRRGGSDGEELGFGAAIDNPRQIVIAPQAGLTQGETVYLKLRCYDQDKVLVEEEITFTVNASTGVDGLQAGAISVYPNPASGRIAISGADGATVTLVNLAGQILLSGQIAGQTATLDLPAGFSGVAMVKIQNGDTVTVRPIVVQ